MANSQRREEPGDSLHRDDEIHLLEYWRVLVQRRMVILICLALVVTATMIVTLLSTPLYRASTTLEIERKGPEIVEFTDVLGIDPAGYMDFYQTQYKILESRSILRLTAERMDLVNRPEYASRVAPPLSRLIGWARSLLAGKPEGSSSPVDGAISFIQAKLTATPIRNSHLVQISFTDRSPQLAADIANEVAIAYQSFQMTTRFKTTEVAKEFLAKDVARVQAEIGDLEHKLHSDGVEKELLSISDGARDISERALADIDAKLTEARARRAAAEARFHALQNAPPEAVPEVLNNPSIARLREDVTDLERQYRQMSERFNRQWPPLEQIKEELDTAHLQLERESRQIAFQVLGASRVDLEQVQAEVAGLERQRDTQKQEVRRVNLDAIEYASAKAEIESKRTVLGDLVARQSQTETSHRLSETSASNIRVVDEAEVPRAPVSPRRSLNLFLALVLGSGLGVGMALLLDHLDNAVKSEQDVLRLAGVPVLAHVPLTTSLRAVDGKPEHGTRLTHRLDLAGHLDPRCGFAETFRNLRTSLLLATPDHPPRRVSVTSCEPGDGKSTVALNLSIVLTQLGRRVLLIDSDLRRPRLHQALGVDNEAGLSNYLSGNASLESLLRPTEIPNLSIITSGPIPPNPSELLGSPGLLALIERFSVDESFDHLIFDSPPVLSVTDSIVIASRVDTTILVVRAGRTSKGSLTHSAAQLAQSHAVVAGAVLNGVRESGSYYYRRERLYRNADMSDSQLGEVTTSDRPARVKTRSGRRRAG